MHLTSAVAYLLLLPSFSFAASSSTASKKPASTGVGVGRPATSLHTFQIDATSTCNGGTAYCTASGALNACTAGDNSAYYCPGYAGCGMWLGKPSCCHDTFASIRNPGQPTNTSCDAYRGYLEAFRMPGQNKTDNGGFYPQGALCSLGNSGTTPNYFFVNGYWTGNPNITLTDIGQTCCPSIYDAIADLTGTPSTALCVPPVPMNSTSSGSANSTASSTASSSSTSSTKKSQAGSLKTQTVGSVGICLVVGVVMSLL